VVTPAHRTSAATVATTAPAQPQREEGSKSEERAHSESPRSQDQSPAAALAGIMNQRASTAASRPQYTPEASDEEEQSTPSLPARPHSQTISSHSMDSSPSYSTGIAASPPHNRVAHRNTHDDTTHNISGGFHMYNINEMVSVMGKRKKMPTTLGINLATGTIMISPEKARDGPPQEWTAEKMTHYSIEGKHVFLELVRPSRSVDFHAGSKDTAEEIVAALGEMAGAVRAEGLREVIMAGSGQAQKRGVVLYDFTAQGDDEVTIAVNDEVIILDDTKSDEWWQVRRVKNSKEGVVPSSYIEVTSTAIPPSSSRLNAGRSTVEQNRLEEQRLAKEAVKDASRPEVGPGVRLPERGSSLSARDVHEQQRSKRDNRASDSGQPRASKSSKLVVFSPNCRRFSF
jgi:actin cytoskeleton-regulatory complex protein SLA1